MSPTNWKQAVNNVLPWINEEMEKKKCNKIVVDMKTLMDKMQIQPEFRKNVVVKHFRITFEKYIIGEGFNVKIYNGFVNGQPTLAILKQSDISPKHEEELKICSYDSVEDHIRILEAEERIRKARFISGVLPKYKNALELNMLPLIKDNIEKSENGIYSMKMTNIRNLIGQKFCVYGDNTICQNIKIVMEDYGIISTARGFNQKKIDNNKVCIEFRYKQDYEKFIWEKKGFASRKEHEEYKMWKRNCNKIRKTVDSRKKDPQSLFNNKELVKNMFSCQTDGKQDKEE